ncbi:hypothetical protein HD598_002279 [Neomicrococcus aestuarii]|uniref:Uncharacterized protein n=1 Tax=Neomicrococcus aestuarii TaxID=556325 RepID=A0A7W8X0U2_9MICC|nr:hypothetical protein [Neomicrococcus aestuarii]
MMFFSKNVGVRAPHWPVSYLPQVKCLGQWRIGPPTDPEPLVRRPLAARGALSLY